MEISETQQRRTETLIPYAGNARTHSEQQVSQIAASITRFGFYNPVLITENDLIIAGHGRVMGAQLLGLEFVPVIVISGLSDEERRALTLADNKIALNSGWDLEKVREELSELAELDLDLESTGFMSHEIDALLRDDHNILPADPSAHFMPIAEEPGKGQLEPKEAKGPGVSDDDYSRFDLVMRHDNKTELVDLLSEIREEMMFEKLEDALMQLVKFWKENQ